MEFWVVPDRAGLPTVDAAAIVAAGGGGASPNVGLGAWVERDAGQSIPDGVITPVVDYDEIFLDELNFLGPDDDGFTIPNVNPPITRVMVSGQVGWNPGGTVDTTRDLSFTLNGSGGTFPPTAANFLPQTRHYVNAASQPLIMFATSIPIPVVAGDFLQMTVTNFDTVARNLSGDNLFSIVVMR
jgi:hypothetical protein